MENFDEDNENKMNINTETNENNELEEIKLELENKNEEISSLQSELNFYKEKNEELNKEIGSMKLSIIDNTLLNNKINNLSKELILRNNELQIKSEENMKLKNDIKNLTDFIQNSLSSLGINIPNNLFEEQPLEFSHNQNDIQFDNKIINDININDNLNVFHDNENENIT